MCNHQFLLLFFEFDLGREKKFYEERKKKILLA